MNVYGYVYELPDHHHRARLWIHRVQSPRTGAMEILPTRQGIAAEHSACRMCFRNCRNECRCKTSAAQADIGEPTSMSAVRFIWLRALSMKLRIASRLTGLLMQWKAPSDRAFATTERSREPVSTAT